MTRKKIYAFVGAVALAFALNGCGGGGATTPAPTPPPEPTPIEQASSALSMATAAQAALPAGASNEMRRDAAQAVATAATAYLALLRADPNASHTEVARVDGLLMAAQATVTAMQAAIDRHNLVSGGKGELQNAQAALTAATDPAGMLEAANAVIAAADAYLELLNADPSTAHSEITRVQNAKSAAMMARDDAEAAIAQANQDRMDAQELADARAALASAKANYMTVNNAAASSSQDRLDAANAVLMAAQALAALDPDSAGEVTTAQSAVDMAQMAVDAEAEDAADMAAVQDARDALAQAKSAAMIANGSVSATAMQRLDAAQAVLDAAIALHDLLVAQNASNSDVAAAATEVATARTGLDVAQAAVDAKDAAAMAAQALQDARDDLAAAQQAVMDLPADATPEARRDAAQAVRNAAQVVRGLLGDDASHAEVTAAQQAVDDAQAALDMAQQAVLDAEEERARLAAAAQRLQDARDALAAAKQAVMDLPGNATSQQQLDAANAVLTAAQTLASLDPAAAMEVTDARAAVDEAQAEVTKDQLAAERMAALQGARDALAAAKQAEAVLPANATAVQRRDAAQAVLTAAEGVRAVLVSQDAAHSDIMAADAEITDATEDLKMAQMAVDEEEATAQAEQALQEAKDALATAKMAVMNLPANATPQQKLDAAEAVRDAAVAYRDMLGTNRPFPEVTAARQDVMDAEAAVMTAQAAVDELEAAQTALTDAKQAEMDLAEDATLQEKLDAAKAVRDAAQEVADLLPGDTDAMEAVTMAQTAVDEAQSAFNMAEAEAATKAAATKKTAIAAEAAQTTDAGLGGTAAPPTSTGQVAGEYNAVIKYDDGQVVTIVVEGATEDANEEPFVLNDMGMHVRTHDAATDGSVKTEVALISTDIEGPTATAFGKVHELDIRVDGTTATDAKPNDALNVVATGLTHVKASAFMAPTGTVGTVVLSFQQTVADDASTTDVNEARTAAEVPGTYQGAMGTYKCNAAAACTVTVDGKGVVSAVSTDNDWIFIPASGATIDVADADYLHYGFWLQKTTDAKGVVTYDEVETFAGSSVDASGDISAVVGSASYEGGATGVYVKEVYDGNGEVESSTSGHFTADVRLMAYFGGDDVSANNNNDVTGWISDFELSGGETNTWGVYLDATDNTGGDGITDGTGVFSGQTRRSDAENSADIGNFSGTFHGDVTSTTVDGETVVPKPSSAVGEFDAVFSNGAVAGAFGARMKED